MAIQGLLAAAAIAGGSKGLASIGQKKRIEEQVEKEKQAIRERFDPSDLGPLLEFFQRRATEGVPESEEALRREQTIEQLFRDQDIDIFGGNQSAAIAGTQAADQSRQQGLADFETRLALEDIRQKQEAGGQLAQVKTKASQIESERDAALREAELQGEAELDRRRQASTASAINIFSTLATTPMGEGGKTPLGDFISGFGGEEAGDITADQLAEVARQGVSAESPDTVIEPEPLTEEELNLGMSAIQQAAELDLPERTGEALDLTTPERPQQTEQDLFGLREFFKQQTQRGESPTDVIGRLSGKVSTEEVGVRQEEPFRLGEETFGQASDFLHNLFGPAATGFDVGTFGTRTLLNLPTDIFRAWQKAGKQRRELMKQRGELVGE